MTEQVIEQQLLLVIQQARAALDAHRLTKPVDLGFSPDEEAAFQAWVDEYHRLYYVVISAEFALYATEIAS